MKYKYKVLTEIFDSFIDACNFQTWMKTCLNVDCNIQTIKTV